MAKDINVIIERTEASLVEAKKLIDEHKNQNRSYLLDSTMREFDYMQKLLPVVKNLTQTLTLRTNQLNKIEEVLLKRENALSEELYFVEEVYRNFKPNGSSKDEIIQFAEKTINDANVEIKKSDYKHTRWEIIRLEILVRDIERVIKEIKAITDPVKKAKWLETKELGLISYEKSVRNIIEKLNFEI